MTVIKFEKKSKNENPWLWLSFRDPELNVFLGALILQAKDVSHAADIAWKLKLNPGGEIAASNITDNIDKIPLIDRGKLLSRQKSNYYCEIL